MSHTEKRILYTLNRREKWRWWAGGNCWYSTKELAKDINRPVEKVKKAIANMRENKILKYSWLYGNNGMLAGSGYLLTTKWDNL